jgi:hypothetical protein
MRFRYIKLPPDGARFTRSAFDSQVGRTFPLVSDEDGAQLGTVTLRAATVYDSGLGVDLTFEVDVPSATYNSIAGPVTGMSIQVGDITGPLNL